MGDSTIGDFVNINASAMIPPEIPSTTTISTINMSETTVKADTDSIISATEADWSRESCRKWWEPSRQLLKSIRGYQKWHQGGMLGRCFRAWYVIWYRFWSVVTGADIPLNCQLGGGLMLPHPNGIVIHPDTSIGPNCMIFQQVTIVGSVEIGGHVDIGAGAKIIRPVKIGEHATIGANAVVVHNVPANATVAGVPAKIIKQKISQPGIGEQAMQAENLSSRTSDVGEASTSSSS